MIYTLLLIILSSIANACMDVVTHHYDKSIFSKYDRYYFDPSISWVNKYNKNDASLGRKQWHGIVIHEAFTDFWHLCKSITICSFIGAVVCYEYQSKWLMLFDFISYGIIWNMTFSLFYNKILIKK